MVIIISYGRFDSGVNTWAEQGPNVTGYQLTEEDLPIRLNAMTGRLQSKLVKCFGWQLFPGHDIYIWVDDSFQLLPGAVDWLLQGLGEADIAVFRHPFNKTIKEEYEFLKTNAGKKYIKQRYTNEFLEEQYKVVSEDASFEDNELFCGGIIIYRNKPEVQNVFKEWWHHITRYHLDDQLSWPYVLKKAPLKINVINNDIYKLELIPFVRKS